MNLDKIIKLRHKLHQHPELSGNEVNTNDILNKFLIGYSPAKIINNIGGYGVAAIYEGKFPGDTVIYRADIDALPIDEEIGYSYNSKIKGISHKCGHDGHTATIASLALYFNKNPIRKGKAVLIFQPSEEIGMGAKLVMNDLKNHGIKPNWAFAFHNLPGFPYGSIIFKKKEFASASKGIILSIKGKSSHASMPDMQSAATIPFYKILNELSSIDFEKNNINEFALLTIIHANLGEIAFGTTPHNAEIMATLRSYNNETLDKLSDLCIDISSRYCKDFNVDFSYSFSDQFEALYNHPLAINLINEASKDLKYNVIEIEKPFNWSEDFGYIANNCKGAMFGVGIGENYHPLHHKDYDFPDEIIPITNKVFLNIAKSIHY